MSVRNILYSRLNNGTQYFNLARDLAWMNQKNEEITTRDGHVFGYIVNVKVHGTVANTLSFGTAPNSWKMRNAFRKWHAYRDMMFADAGVTDSEKGRYGKTIRPYLSAGMKSGDIRAPFAYVDDPASGTVNSGEWSYTQIAAAPGFDEAAVGTEGAAAVDVYDLNILGENQVSTTTTLGTQYYSAVGMIHSYNQDRQEVVTPSVDAETVEGHNNPLALLRYKGTSGGEVMTIVEDQELEKPPYDIADNGVSATLTSIAELMQINPGWNGSDSIPVVRTGQLFVPAGLFSLYTTSARS